MVQFVNSIYPGKIWEKEKEKEVFEWFRLNIFTLWSPQMSDLDICTPEKYYEDSWNFTLSYPFLISTDFVVTTSTFFFFCCKVRLREEFKIKKDPKEWHRTYLGLNPPYPPN